MPVWANPLAYNAYAFAADFPITAAPSPSLVALARRAQDARGVKTCGYKDGNLAQSRKAGDGFECRIDTRDGAWGFCAETATGDCGLMRMCVDSHSCSTGCGTNIVSSKRTLFW